MFVSGVDRVKPTLTVVSEAAAMAQGIGTVVLVDCSEGDGKKLCKKLKFTPKTFLLKHYQ